jgi:Ca2+-binding RTX toxin-like protein
MTPSPSATPYRPARGHRLAHAWVLVSLASAACLGEPDIDEAELELTASYKAQVKSRTLIITGNNADSSLTLRLGATTATLEVDVGDDGTADFRFDRSKFERIRIDAGGGDDVVRMDEQAGAFTSEEQVTMNGGSGNDTLLGGVGPETFLGGTGNDLVVGRYGADTVSLGAGDDTYVWDPGGVSDTLEGDDGFDTLVFTGANIDEQFELGAVGDRVRMTRDIAQVTMDLHGLELVDLHVRGGGDRIVVGDLTGTALAQVRVDLDSSVAGQGDQLADTVVVSGTPAGDVVDVARDGAAVTAATSYAAISVVNGEPSFDRLIVNGEANDAVNINGTPDADSMVVLADASGVLYDGGGFNVLVAPSAAVRVAVNGLAGDDHIATVGGVTAPLVLDGGDGNDQMDGGAGNDVLRGGAGNDIVDGHFGDDTAVLGDGDDLYLWDPGDRSDLVDGGAGADGLIFTGSGANETIDLRASGSRVTLSRDIATVVMDLGDIERITVRARGGSDRLVVNPLSGTAATAVDVDLAPYDPSTGDGLTDTVVVNGTPGIDVIDVGADGGAVVATGLGARLSVTNGEPALDRLAVYGGLLRVNGTPAADTMVVLADASGALYDGGGFNVLVAASGVADVRVLGHGGDDSIATSGGIATPLYLDGGDGDDHLSGGSVGDVLLGGAGNDVVSGGLGADTALLGDGDDLYLWNPGDASDVVDGELGADALLFSGAAIGETFEIKANGSRVALTRTVGTVAMDLAGLERIDLAARGGSDVVAVGDLTGTPLTRVNLDLAYAAGGPTGDGAADSVVVFGSPLDDAIAIAPAAGGLLVSGLSAAVQIASPELSDQLSVYGLGGADSFAVDPAVPGIITLSTYQEW